MDRRPQGGPTVRILSPRQRAINSAALGEKAPLHRRWSRSRLKIDAFFASIVQGSIQPLRDGQPGEKVIGSPQDGGLGAFIRRCPAKLNWVRGRSSWLKRRYVTSSVTSNSRTLIFTRLKSPGCPSATASISNRCEQRKKPALGRYCSVAPKDQASPGTSTWAPANTTWSRAKWRSVVASKTAASPHSAAITATNPTG